MYISIYEVDGEIYLKYLKKNFINRKNIFYQYILMTKLFLYETFKYIYNLIWK